MLLGLGVLCLGVTMLDALTTTVAPDTGGGVVTGRLARGSWSLLRRLARRPGGLVHRSLGPTVTVLTIGTWLVGLWLGWFLVLSASPDAVVADATGEPADGWTRFYFAGFAVFTLGIGDQVPAGTPWQIVTVLAAVTGLVFTTLAITFVLPVVTAVTERRRQASRIAGLGEDAQAIVLAGWDGAGFGVFEQVLPDLASEVLLTAERNLSYPILAYFHAARPSEDHRVQLAVLDAAASLLLHAVDHDEDRTTLPNGPAEDQHHPPRSLDLAPLRAAGIPTVDDEVFDRAVDGEAAHRDRLARLVASSGWPEPVLARTRDG